MNQVLNFILPFQKKFYIKAIWNFTLTLGIVNKQFLMKTVLCRK